MAIGVDADGVAVFAAEHLPNRHAVSFAESVQQRRFNAGESVPDQAGRSIDCHGAEPAKQTINRRRILTDRTDANS